MFQSLCNKTDLYYVIFLCHNLGVSFLLSDFASSIGKENNQKPHNSVRIVFHLRNTLISNR